MLGSLSLAVSLNSANGDLASGWRSRFLGENMICVEWCEWKLCFTGGEKEVCSFGWEL